MFKRLPISIINHTPLKHILDRFSEGVIPVFMLHRVEDEAVNGVSIAQIDNFLSSLKRYGYEFIGIEELCNLIEKPGAVIKNKVMFTMDDGYEDQVVKGVPVFQKHKCPVSIAIITNFISGSMWPWDAKIRYLFENTKKTKCAFTMLDGRQLTFKMDNIKEKFRVMRDVRGNLKHVSLSFLLASIDALQDELDIQLPFEAPEHYKAFTWNDVKRLEGDGVNFIPHTQNHYILSNLSDDEAKNEIEGSINDLKQHIDPIPAFIYPNGRLEDFNGKHTQLLRNNGIKVAFTTDNSYLSLNELSRTNDDSLCIPRIEFPVEKDIQDKVLTKIDYIADRIRDRTFSELFEMTYGIKRTAISKYIENIIHKSYLHKARNIDSGNIGRIIFICIGNICRSPFAEVVALKENCGLPVISMGLQASGNASPDLVAQKVAKEFGYNLDDLCSTKIEVAKLKSSDLLVVMEVSQLKELEYVTKKVKCQITLLGVWDDQPMLSIDDPYGRSESRFRKVFTQIKPSVHNLLNYINDKSTSTLN